MAPPAQIEEQEPVSVPSSEDLISDEPMDIVEDEEVLEVTEQYEPISPEQAPPPTPFDDGNGGDHGGDEEKDGANDDELPQGSEEEPVADITDEEPEEEPSETVEQEDEVEEEDIKTPEAEPSTASAVPEKETVEENAGEEAPTVKTHKKPAVAQEEKKETQMSNEVIEQTRSRLLEKQNSRVRALVGAFETVMALQDPGGQTGQHYHYNATKESAEST